MTRLALAIVGICLSHRLAAENNTSAAPAPPTAGLVAETALETPDVLPDLGEIPNPAMMDDPWALLDRPLVDPALLGRERWSPPAAASLLPPAAIRPPARRYQALRFDGNHVFRSDELSRLIPWATERSLGPDERAALEDVITRHYVSQGYINSGAVVPEPAGDADELVVEITEGKLTEVVLDRAPGVDGLPADDCLSCVFTGNRRLRKSYLHSRVMGDRNQPLNFPELQQRLQIMQLNPNIKRLQAELKPSLLPGEATVNLVIEENPAWSYGVDLHNDLPPSVGAEQMDLWMEHANLTGFSDALSMRYGIFGGGVEETQAAGFDNLRVDYARPVWWDDTRIEGFYDRQGYAIIEEPFTELDITGDTWSAGGGVRRPIFRNLRDDVWWGISLARKHSETELLGKPFSVSPGYVDGELDLTLLQAGIDWVSRHESEVITAAVALVAGLDGLGATEVPTEPDESFLLVRANARYLARLNSHDHLLALRGALQWADAPLPSPEQWTLGGYSSVRGYRQNELVRDAGATAGVEYRIPMLDGDPGQLNFVSFIDGGIGVDHDGGNAESLVSIGIGLTGNYRNWLRGELFWGLPLINHEDTGDNLQDLGISFRLTAGKF